MNHQNGGFNFFSQNTQGHRGDVHTSMMSQFHNDKLHVAALQETGSLPGASFKQAKGTPNLFTGEIKASDSTRTTRRSNKPSVHGVFYNFKGGKGKNNRTSMALFSKEKPRSSGVIKPRVKGVRPMMFMELNDMIVTNVHLPSGRPAFASKVLHGFLEDLSQIPGLNKRSKKATLILGDLNMDRKRARKTASAHGFDVSSPSGPTHQGGNTLDHAITQGGNVMSIETHFTSSDHGTLHGTFKP